MLKGRYFVTYQALYRTWRPRTFSRLIGQNHVSRTLLNALKKDRLSHAYLFCGPRGTGKTSTAKILAQAVNCENPLEGEPCGECPSCLEITSGRTVDVLEIDAASNRGIDEIRDLRDKVRFAPAQLKHKVYIIDEVHMLTPEAFNALLKTLEEPPRRVSFILATTEPHKLPATILSRCQRFDFFPLEARDIALHLAEVIEKEGRQAKEEALLILARGASGGMRDALSLLEQALAFCDDELTPEAVLQVLGQAGIESFLDLTKKIASSDVTGSIEVIDIINREGKDLSQFARDLLMFFRDLALARLTPEGSRLLSEHTPENMIALKEAAQLFSREALLEMTEEITRILNEMKWTEQPRLVLEVGLFRLCHLPPRLTLKEVMEKVTALEEKLASLEKGHEPRALVSSSPNPTNYAISSEPVIKKENKGNIVKKKERIQNTSPERKKTEVEEEIIKETGAGVTLEAVVKVWPNILKTCQKQKPMVYTVIKDSLVQEVSNSIVKIGFRKNSDFCCGMLERRKADKTFIEFLLEKSLNKKLEIKTSSEPVIDAVKSPSLPSKEEPPMPEPPPEEEIELLDLEPHPKEQEEKSTGDEKREDNNSGDLLLESAKDIFNGNFVDKEG